MAEQQQDKQQYNDGLADAVAIVLFGTVLIGTVVYWLATM